jgi:hypothetical protein
MAGMVLTVSRAAVKPRQLQSNELVLLDPGTYIFYNATMSRNHEPYKNYPGEYSTDLISAAAVGFLDNAIAASDRPFFLGVAPIAPHSETITSPNFAKFNPPVPAKRHEHLFQNVTIPRTPNFNPDKVRQYLSRLKLFTHLSECSLEQFRTLRLFDS